MLMENSLFLNTCLGNFTKEKPVWMMRQAGRYLPEYLKLRSEFPDFLSFVKNPKAAAEATLQPLRRFSLDAAILFSDILVLLPLLGIPLKFIPGFGPQIETPVRTEKNFYAYKGNALEKDLAFTKEAIELTKENLNKNIPLLGFIGGPLTLASYAIEGKTSKDLHETKKLFYSNPEFYNSFLETIATLAGTYLKSQAKWGCDALVIMDSWAGHLSKQDYLQMAFPYTKRVIEIAKEANVPILHYANGAVHLLPEFLKLPANGFGLDYRTDLKETLEKYPGVLFQGNLDPAVLLSTKQEIVKRTKEMLECTLNRPHIINLGHGILPETPLENVQTFIETVKSVIV